MTILHIDFTGPYTEGAKYQENIIPAVNARDGNDVFLFVTRQTWENGKCVDIYDEKHFEYVDENNVNVVRMPYIHIISDFLTFKIRAVGNLFEKIKKVSPDVIMLHCLQTWAVHDVIRYKKAYPKVKLYADTHTDAKNSGTNWLSLHILHRVFYKYLAQKAVPYLERYFYTTKERKMFAMQHYGMPVSLMEFYPLGGIIMPQEERTSWATKVREELKLSSKDILFVHSGKIDALKKTTELIRAFSAVPDTRFKLVIIGSISDDICKELNSLIAQDTRIVYIGWKSGDELQSYLCACDMYLQPGSQSATLENALCCGTAIMTYPHESYDECYVSGNGFYVKTLEDMVEVFSKISTGKVDLSAMGAKSLLLAHEYFDYRELASRLYK